MLTRNERIKYSGLFEQAYEKGRSLNSEHLRICFTQSLEHLKDKLPLVGFVVSKKFSKKAVKRNRIKRQIREIYRLYRQDEQNAEKLKSAGLLVISLNSRRAKNKPELSYEGLQRELKSLLDQV